ncbi:hypothetical protein NKR23_g12202 [Pleurostoma richardsiae]|uniref:Rhodanese domain-containing protein n=1 Tax=Pleurostoma richardsiae TaxID=41990 RepID=A0AA38R9X4_9PEZI|nr:hypothetical protein NKR23_g12202 [Pleurostoma richardsiae]
MASSQQTSTAPEALAPWYAAYPAPRNSQPAAITREKLLKMIKGSESVAGKDFILVDLRRTDYQGGTIHGSINLPAQSLHPTIPTLYSMFKAAGISKVIWYCSSSRGRGARAAAWFSDYADDRGDSDIHSLILFEGINGWATAGGEFVKLMNEYDATFWVAK